MQKLLRKLGVWWKARKKWEKVLVVVGGIIVGIPILAMIYLRLAYPDARDVDPGLEIDRTPPAITRGEYLYHAVADCAGCHTRRDFTKFGGPQVADIGGGFGDLEKGGLKLPFADLPGDIYPSNITMDRETGLGKWNDDEIIRAIREGVSHDDRPLFPLMPYPDYRYMSDTDVQAIVAYIRNLPAIPRAIPDTDIDFPLNFIFRTIPEPLREVVPDINRQDRVKYGEYLARMAGCIECHTERVDGERQEERLLAGGQAFALEGWNYEVVSSNLTPDPSTGMRLTEQQFVDRFKSFEAMAKGEEEIPNVSRDNATAMPWFAFSGINDSDLRTIYAYLKSVRPVRNQVTKRRNRTD